MVIVLWVFGGLLFCFSQPHFLFLFWLGDCFNLTASIAAAGIGQLYYSLLSGHRSMIPFPNRSWKVWYCFLKVRGIILRCLVTARSHAHALSVHNDPNWPLLPSLGRETSVPYACDFVPRRSPGWLVVCMYYYST